MASSGPSDRSAVPPPAARSRLVARAALVLLAVAIVIVAVRGVVPLGKRYGYREVKRAHVWMDGGLTVSLEQRRWNWLPLPVDRVRVLNHRDEEVARFDGHAGSGTRATSFILGRSMDPKVAGSVILCRGSRVEVSRDPLGVLVPGVPQLHSERRVKDDLFLNVVSILTIPPTRPTPP